MSVTARDVLVAVLIYVLMVLITGQTGIEPKGVPARWWRRRRP